MMRKRSVRPTYQRLLALAGAALVLAISACSSTNSTTASWRPDVVDVKDAVTFDSLNGLIGGSTLIVEGTVTDIAKGRTLGTPDGSKDGGGSFTSTYITLKLDQVLKGEYSKPELIMEDTGLEQGAPSRPGDHGIYFLVQQDIPGLYRIVNSQARFLVTSEGTLASINGTDGTAPWEQDAQNMSIDELRQAVLSSGPPAPSTPSG